MSLGISKKLPSVVIVGGSFGGFSAAKHLAAKGIADVHVIERFKYHAHSFAFPRYSVFAKKRDEADLFVPISESNNRQLINVIFSAATNVTETTVETADGSSLIYDYLVIATGFDRGYPAGYGDVTPQEGSNKMKEIQQQIESAENIALVGAGAFGVQLATDIKWVYKSEKRVTLYNSRPHILPRFADHVWQMAEPIIEKLGVRLVNETRPKILNDKALSFVDKVGDEKNMSYDLVLDCSGRRSTLGPFERFLNEKKISPSGLIYTEPTLQIPGHPNVFAVGDVVHDAPHMAKAARAQGTIAAINIEQLIAKSNDLIPYKPTDRENTIKLTLGYEKSLIGKPSNAKLLSHDPKYEYKVDKIKELYNILTSQAQL